MKKRYHILLLLVFAVSFASCDLVGNIDDIKPFNKLTDENIVSDAASAEALLREVYRNWRTSNLDVRPAMSCMSGALKLVNPNLVPGGTSFSQNKILASDQVSEALYASLYTIINYANIVIDRLNSNEHITGLPDARKEEMLAECRFHRGMAHFYLLRHFGEFYNMDSQYGIVLCKDRFVDGNKQPRSSVREAYDFILEDLTFASQKAPENVGAGRHYYVSGTTAKALKAKVLLYMGDYPKAELTADSVLNEAASYGYALEQGDIDSFEWMNPEVLGHFQLFTNSYESSEVLFAFYAFGTTESFETYAFRGVDSSSYTSMLAQEYTAYGIDWRFELTFTGMGQTIGQSGTGGGGDGGGESGGDGGFEPEVMAANDDTEGDIVEPDDPGDGPGDGPDIPGSGDPQNHRYPYGAGTSGAKGDTYYFMRLAEVYYIYAEAAARNNHLTEARGRMGEVMERLGDPWTLAGTPDDRLLEYIRVQKWLEFVSENYEEWFDLIRYYKAGNLTMGQLTEIKSTLNSEKQFIMPIPRKALSGNDLLIQNP